MENRTIFDRIYTARGNMHNPPMNGRAQYGRYATLADVLAIVQPALYAEGVFLSQRIVSGKLETVAVTENDTLLLDQREVDLSGNSQQQGSAETYAKRYALCSVFGLVGMDDDDGAAATKPAQAPKSSAARNKAIKRLNAAMEAYSASHGGNIDELKAGIKRRPDYEDTAGFYDLVASEFEAAQ